MLVLPVFTAGSNEGFIWAASRTFVLLACVNVLRSMSHSWLLMVLMALAATASEWLTVLNLDSEFTHAVSFLLFGVFVILITYQVLKQIMVTNNIDMHIIVGAFCGFMLIGIIASLVFTFLYFGNPDSFSNINPSNRGVEDLFYFSFITILTIGYGDIAPLTDTARSLSLFFGLIGQFYLVVIMAVLVGKFIGKSE